MPGADSPLFLEQKREQDRRLRRRLVNLEPQFVPLLVSVLLVVLLLPVTVQAQEHNRWMISVLLGLLLIQTLRALPLLIPSQRPSRIAVRLQWLLGVSALTLLLIQPVLTSEGLLPRLLRVVMLLLLALFALLACVRLVRLLAMVPRVNAQVMAGAAAGYLYLGLTGGLLASALQVLLPGTFALGNQASQELLLDRLTYFSFVVLGGLGLGDVLPANAFGERFVIVLSVAGTLYLTLLMGLLIGRFLATAELEMELEALEDQIDAIDSQAP